MQPVLPTPPTLPQSSLTIELEMMQGVNNIRRSLGRAVSLALGSAVVDRTAILLPNATLTITEATKAFCAVSSGGLNVTVNGLALSMLTLMSLDTPTTSLVFHNASTSQTVSLHLAYLVP